MKTTMGAVIEVFVPQYSSCTRGSCDG